jgi:hypothetical protein
MEPKNKWNTEKIICKKCESLALNRKLPRCLEDLKYAEVKMADQKR